MSDLAKALASWQGDLPSAAKSGKNPHFKSRFSTLQDIVDCARGAASHGIAFTQEVDFDDAKMFVRTVMLHASGEMRESRTPIITRDANDPQKLGSAITYAKRYGLQAMFGIPDNMISEARGRLHKEFIPIVDQFYRKVSAIPL